MKSRTLALGGAAAIAFAGLLSLTPAVAHTSQPATPEEIQQTDALNAQSLVNARSGDATVPRTLANTNSTDISTTTPNSNATPMQPTANSTTPNGSTPNSSTTPDTGGTNP